MLQNLKKLRPKLIKTRKFWSLALWKAPFLSEAFRKAPRRLWLLSKPTDGSETPNLPWKCLNGAWRLSEVNLPLSNCKKAKKIDEFFIFKLFLCTHGAFLICGSSGLEKIHFDIQISSRSNLKRRKRFQSMYRASGAFEAHASVSYKLQNASKFETNWSKF